MPPQPSKNMFARLWDFLFVPRRPVRCPYCLRSSSLRSGEKKCNTAGGCGWDMPVEYLARCDTMPALFVPVLGWTGCGKTWSLLAMTYALWQMNRVWGDYTREAGDMVTSDWVRKLVRGGVGGVTQKSVEEISKATPSEKVQPARIVFLNNLPNRWRAPGRTGRTLVIRDFGGENFRMDAARPTIPADQLSFIAAADTVVLMYCLPHLTPMRGRTDAQTRHVDMGIDDLFKVYTKSMITHLQKEHGCDYKTAWDRFKARGVKVIVVLSQADEMKGDDTLPANLVNYLDGDPIDSIIRRKANEDWTEKEMGEYLEKMNRTSDAIREYLTVQFSDAKNMLNLDKEYGVTFKFCLTSSTGPVKRSDEHPDAPFEPQRILDPLFMALQFGESHKLV